MFGWNLCYEFQNETERRWMVGCAHAFLTGSADLGVDER